MGVIALTRFESQPGHAGKHLELHLEALQRLRGLGMRAVAMQPLAGGDIGSLVMSINYADNADYASSMQKVQADEGWQSFYSGAMASGAAVQVESSLFSDLDPTFQPAADRPMGVLLATQWRSRPGRMEDFVGKVIESDAHVRRLGGVPRPLQSVIGEHPMSMLVPIAFADMDAYGAYADKLATDAEWQAFWGDTMKDPSADMLRSGIYLNISGD
jgi:hypothetical protein